MGRAAATKTPTTSERSNSAWEGTSNAGFIAFHVFCVRHGCECSASTCFVYFGLLFVAVIPRRFAPIVIIIVVVVVVVFVRVFAIVFVFVMVHVVVLVVVCCC